MKIELCVASVDALHIVKELAIDRIELCQNLEQGGTTPSFGLIEMALSKELEVHVLIRPRAGGFVYSEEEIKVMLNDIEVCRTRGVKGVVIGALNTNSQIDTNTVLRMKEAAKEMQVTFHRAFDESFNWRNSMEFLIDSGINRVLTAGLASSVDLGLPTLTEMMHYANKRIEIMVGGGVNLGNINRIVAEVQPDAIHFSGTSKVLLDEQSNFSESILQIDRGKVEKLIQSIRRR